MQFCFRENYEKKKLNFKRSDSESSISQKRIQNSWCHVIISKVSFRSEGLKINFKLKNLKGLVAVMSIYEEKNQFISRFLRKVKT